MTISTQQFNTINIGSSPNDGTGDTLRTAFNTVNQNFSNIASIGFNAGNILASGVVQAAGITNTGAQVETGYTQLKPAAVAGTANVAVAINNGINRLLLHPTGAVISFGANVTLPNTQTDGTIVSISSNVTIAQLSVTPNWNGVVTVSPFGNTGPVTAGTVNRFMYIAADKIWYKIA